MEDKIRNTNGVLSFVSTNPVSTFWTISFLVGALISILQPGQTYCIRQLIGGSIEIIIFAAVFFYMGIEKMTELVDESPVLYFFALALLGGLADVGPLISISITTTN